MHSRRLSVAEFAPLTAEELQRLGEFLYRRTGMVFAENKRYYTERRVVDRMTATGSESFVSYLSLLRSDAEREIELLINAFTVNETYFYREDHQLRCLTNNMLPERLKASSRNGNEHLRIWSVPCSTGEEPYSIAIWLLENWPLVDRYEIEIWGSDIDTAALKHCEQGIFSRRALQRLSPAVVDKYFVQLDQDHWRILDELRESVQFSRVNIIRPEQTRPHGRFDVIFCRNVLIYFDDASRRVAAENLYESLQPEGFICLGHSESMSRISPLFEVRRFEDAIVYQRPEASHG